jgi:hypothetical protein
MITTPHAKRTPFNKQNSSLPPLTTACELDFANRGDREPATLAQVESVHQFTRRSRKFSFSFAADFGPAIWIFPPELKDRLTRTLGVSGVPAALRLAS